MRVRATPTGRGVAQETSGAGRLKLAQFCGADIDLPMSNELGILPARCRLYEEKHAVAYGVCVSQEPHTPAACFCLC